MARVSSTIPNLINGVSQQPPSIRLQTQAELQMNCFSSVVGGLRKRPPTIHLAEITGIDDLAANTVTSLSHFVNRDKDERYNVFIYRTKSGSGNIKVFDLEGNERPVRFPNGKSYLNHPGNLKSTPFRLLTLADTTFIANQTVVVKEAADTAPVRPPETMINVISGNYGKTYELKIDGSVKARYSTPDGSNAKQAPGVDTNFIAKRLVNGTSGDWAGSGDDAVWAFKSNDTNLNASGINSANGWHTEVFGSTVYIRNDNGTEFSIEIEDGFGGRAMVPAKDTIQNFSDLPRYGKSKFVIEINNSEGTEADNYFVQFIADRSNGHKGIWRETCKPGIKTRLDPATMPHLLIREADGGFAFQRADWDPRMAGDDNSAPFPSFTGQTINDMAFFKNRLTFLSGENMVLSKAGDYFDFFRTTATQLLDDDPIDIEAGHSKVSILRDAISFQDRMMVFSSRTQFQMKGNELLTPKTASMRPVTEFESSSLAKVVAAGKYLYFPVDRGTFTMIREYSFDSQTEIGDADDVTSHVPQYVPGQVYRMDASSHEDMLVCATRERPNQLFVYKYFWVDEQKMQSSWSTWELPGVEEIITFNFYESELVLFVKRREGYFIEKIEIHPGAKDVGSNFVTCLDRRIYIERPSDGDFYYDPFLDETEIHLPYEPAANVECATGGTLSYESDNLVGQPVQVLRRVGKMVVLRGDFRDTPLYFGTPYESRYRLSPIYIRRESSGGGMTTETKGRLQILHVQVQYADTAYFKVEVTPHSRPTQSYYFNGRVLGDPANVIGLTALMDGTFKFPVMSRNDRVQVDIVNDTYLPFSLLSAEWFGTYSPKARSI